MATGTTLPAAALEHADDVFVLRQVLRVELALGVELSAERRAAIAETVLALGYSRVEVERAAIALASDVRLDQKLRFGGAFSAADFRRLVEGDPEDTGSALVRLMTYAEANSDAIRRRISITHYRPVYVEGREAPMWTPAWVGAPPTER